MNRGSPGRLFGAARKRVSGKSVSAVLFPARTDFMLPSGSVPSGRTDNRPEGPFAKPDVAFFPRIFIYLQERAVFAGQTRGNGKQLSRKNV